MRIDELLNQQSSGNADLIVEQLDAIILTELFGGLSALAGAAKSGVQAGARAVGDRVKSAGQAVASKYNEGEIRALVNQYEKYKQQLKALIQKHPYAFATESESIDKDVLVELMGGLGAVFGAARDKVKSGMQAVGQRAQQAGRAVGSTYAKGEAAAILRKMSQIAKELKSRGYKITPQQASEFGRLRKMVGL